MNVVLPITGFIIGIILGSFTLSLASRSLSNKSFWGRSYCQYCNNKLRWYDLFPILSYLTLRGKCRYCHRKLSIEYLLVELIMGILVAGIFFRSDPYVIPVSTLLTLVFQSFFVTVLIAVAITDFRKTLIPDRIMIPAIYISLVSLVAFTIFKIGYLYWFLSQSELGRLLLPPHNEYFTRHAILAGEPLILGLVSAFGLAGFFLLLIFATKGKGMGGGDVKLGAFIGLGLGFPNALLAAVLAFVIGAVYALVAIILGKKHFGENIPFGPFLVLGSLIALFWGNQIIDWYLRLNY